jgi:membrane-bound serine protease (ClpP class)
MDPDILINPNLAYLLLVTGFVLGMSAVLTPGTGLLEIGALIAFVLAGWEIIYLPINWWALVILILGVFPFLIAVRLSKKVYFLVISIAALVVGSVFLFDAPGWQPAVNPWLALIVSTLVVIYMWVATTKSIQAASLEPSHDLASLIGQEGEARTEISSDGSVYVNGELWSACSDQPISAGTRVRVLERQGLILTVEALEPDPESSNS